MYVYICMCVIILPAILFSLNSLTKKCTYIYFILVTHILQCCQNYYLFRFINLQQIPMVKH